METDTSNNEKAWHIYGNYIDEVLRMSDTSGNDYYYLHDPTDAASDICRPCKKWRPNAKT